jgi:hypothetical protein
LDDRAFLAAPGSVEAAFDGHYRWDPGAAIGRFLDGLAEGVVRATVCPSCARTLVPPRAFCERCFLPIEGWVEVPATGVVETYSRCHVSWDMQTLDEPRYPAVIRLDDTSEGGFLHLLGGLTDEPAIGMRVEAVWRPPDERTGSILDIAWFRPAEGATS